MKLNMSFPQTGCIKTIEVDNEKNLLPFYDKRIGAEVPADSLGDEFKGYILKITGGNDKQGFPMLQGVLKKERVRLLFKKGMKCFRERRRGQMKRKSVRGCIVGSDISALNLAVIQRGEAEIPGLTDKEIPQRLGPKRASKIRKLFNLSKDDDVRLHVIKREVKPGKFKAPKIQRLITPERLRRKQKKLTEKRNRRRTSRAERADYEKIASEYAKSRVLHKKEALTAHKSEVSAARQKVTVAKQAKSKRVAAQ